jgi:hypothetical protein
MNTGFSGKTRTIEQTIRRSVFMGSGSDPDGSSRNDKYETIRSEPLLDFVGSPLLDRTAAPT